jgi:hypothetical protein
MLRKGEAHFRGGGFKGVDFLLKQLSKINFAFKFGSNFLINTLIVLLQLVQNEIPKINIKTIAVVLQNSSTTIISLTYNLQFKKIHFCCGALLAV